MKNNFEVKNIDLKEMNEIVEIKDDELKMVTGGYYSYQSYYESCDGEAETF